MRYSNYYCANGEEATSISGYSSEFLRGVGDVMDSPAFEERMEELILSERISNRHVISFLERSMGRFLYWMRHPRTSICQISAYRHEPPKYHERGRIRPETDFTKKANSIQHKLLRRDIDNLGYSAQLVKGSYVYRKKGGPTIPVTEWSWIVIGLRGREKDADGRSTPKDVFEEEMLGLARTYHQESIIITKPSRRLIHLAFTDNRGPTAFTKVRVGAQAIEKLKNHQLALQQGQIPSGGGHARTGRNNPYAVWVLTDGILPISRPAMGFMSLGGMFLNGLVEDGRGDLLKEIEDYYSYDGLRVYEEKWWRDISKEERRWGLEMDRRITRTRHEFHELETSGTPQEATEAIDEMYALVDEFREWRQGYCLEDGGGRSRSRRYGVDRG